MMKNQENHKAVGYLFGVSVWLVCILVFPSSAWSQIPQSMFNEDGNYVTKNFLTGNDLLQYCNYEPSTAFGYVMGVLDALSNRYELRASAQGSATIGQFQVCLEKLKHDRDEECFSPPFCIPTQVTSKQIADVVCKWIEDNPGKRHTSARGAVFSALMNTFPCLETKAILDARMQGYGLKK